MTSIKGIQSLSLNWFVFGQNPLMMCFSGLSKISYIFDLLEILLSVSNHIQLWNHMVFYYLGSQSTIPFGIKSTLFTLCICMKLILAHYRCIWCFILYTSYGCFFEVHLRWFNRWPVCSLFHNAYNLWVTRNITRKWVQMKKIDPILNKKVQPRVRENEMVFPMLARAWQKSRYCDNREDSTTLIVVVAILTD